MVLPDYWLQSPKVPFQQVVGNHKHTSGTSQRLSGTVSTGKAPAQLGNHLVAPTTRVGPYNVSAAASQTAEVLSGLQEVSNLGPTPGWLPTQPLCHVDRARTYIRTCTYTYIHHLDHLGDLRSGLSMSTTMSLLMSSRACGLTSVMFARA